jgi:hypothetical protein
VNNASPVCIIQSSEQLNDNADCVPDGQVHPFLQRAAFHIFRSQKRYVTVFSLFVNSNDSRMIETGCNTRLMLKMRNFGRRLGIAWIFGDRLQSHYALLTTLHRAVSAPYTSMQESRRFHIVQAVSVAGWPGAYSVRGF